MPKQRTVTLTDATAIYDGDELVATAMYSNAGQCWDVSDERTHTHLGRFDNRTDAETHLGFVR